MKNDTRLTEEIAFKSGYFAAQQVADQTPGWSSDDAWKEFLAGQEKAASGEIISERTSKN